MQNRPMRDRVQFFQEVKQALIALLPSLVEKKILLLGVREQDRKKYIAQVKSEMNASISRQVRLMQDQQMIYDGISKERLVKAMLSAVGAYLNEAKNEEIQDILHADRDEQFLKGDKIGLMNRFAHWQFKAWASFQGNQHAQRESNEAWNKELALASNNISGLDLLQLNSPSILKSSLFSFLLSYFTYLTMLPSEKGASEDMTTMNIRILLLASMLFVAFAPMSEPYLSAFKPNLTKEEDKIASLIDNHDLQQEVTRLNRMHKRNAHNTSSKSHSSSTKKSAENDEQVSQLSKMSFFTSSSSLPSPSSITEKAEAKRIAKRKYATEKKYKDKYGQATDNQDANVNRDLIQIKGSLHAHFSAAIAKEHMSADQYELIPQFTGALRSGRILASDSKGATGLKRVRGEKKGIIKYEAKISGGQRFFFSKTKMEDKTVLEVVKYKSSHS